MTLKTCAKNRIFCVAFGGNEEGPLGSVEKTFQTALAEIENRGLRITSTSRFYDTPAFPPGSGPNFVNGAVLVETTLEPAEFLGVLHEIEADNGRQRIKRWGARTLDLDLIFCDQVVLPDAKTWAYWHNLPADRQQAEAPDRLILPHPRLHERAFVLVPIHDIAPEWRHPVLGKTITEMLSELPKNLLDEVKPL